MSRIPSTAGIHILLRRAVLVAVVVTPVAAPHLAIGAPDQIPGYSRRATAVGASSLSATGPAAPGATPPSAVALPVATEKLPEQITLSECPRLRIVEWRATSTLPYTAKSDAGVAVIEKACKLALARYPAFLKSKGLSFTRAALSVDVALMPANTILEGKDPRNLNDTKGRFQVVQPTCCSWGIFDAPLSFLFLRNDPVYDRGGVISTNKFFVRTLLHEMAHVLNDKWQVKTRHFPGNDQRDEEIAEEWVSFLGIRYKTESSSEDYGVKMAVDSPQN